MNVRNEYYFRRTLLIQLLIKIAVDWDCDRLMFYSLQLKQTDF